MFTVHTMAAATQPRSIMADGEYNNIPYPKTKRPNDKIRYIYTTVNTTNCTLLIATVPRCKF